MRDAPQPSLQPPAATGTVSIQASTSPKPAAWSTQHPATPWTARLVLSPRGRWTLGVKGVTTPAMLWHTLPAGGEDTCCSLPEPSGCRRGLGTYIHTHTCIRLHPPAQHPCVAGKVSEAPTHCHLGRTALSPPGEAKGQGLISTPGGATHSYTACLPPAAPPLPMSVSVQGLPHTNTPWAPFGKSFPPPPLDPTTPLNVHTTHMRGPPCRATLPCHLLRCCQ